MAIWFTIHSGCASTAVIAAAGVTAGFGLAQGQAESFITGELKAARMVPLEPVLRATRMAMDEMQLQIIECRTSDHDAYIMAKSNVGPEFKVKLKSKSPIVTKIEIRIGIMGDLSVSRLVLSRIDAKLGIVQPLVPVEESPFVAPPPASLPASVSVTEAPQ